MIYILHVYMGLFLKSGKLHNKLCILSRGLGMKRRPIREHALAPKYYWSNWKVVTSGISLFHSCFTSEIKTISVRSLSMSSLSTSLKRVSVLFCSHVAAGRRRVLLVGGGGMCSALWLPNTLVYGRCSALWLSNTLVYYQLPFNELENFCFGFAHEKKNV